MIEVFANMQFYVESLHNETIEETEIRMQNMIAEIQKEYGVTISISDIGSQVVSDSTLK